MISLITPQSLKDLVDAKAIERATVVADKDSYKVVVKYGVVERAVSVRTRDGKTKERLFTSLNAVAKFMREKVQLDHYDVNAANFDPLAVRSKRPDTSQRLIGAHAALSHREWLEQKVSESRAGLVDGTNQRIEPQAWDSIRAAKRAQRDAR